MKLYKYCSIKAGLEIIRKSRVLLSNPSDFNDPFDSIFDIDEKEIEKAKELVLNYEIFKGLYSAFHDGNFKLANSAQKVLVNGIRNEFEICKKLLIKTQKFEPVPLLNSNLKRLSNLNPALKPKLKKIYQKFDEEVVDPVKMVAGQAYISCFSKIPDSILMWSHYANSHKGICIEIEENRKDFKDVIYSKQRAKFDINDVIKRILASNFLGTKFDGSDDEYNYKMLRPFFTKSEDWKYEDEVRCLVSSKNPDIDGFEIDDCLPFLSVNITKIFIGMNVKDNDLNEVLKLAYHRGIPVVYMEKHPTDFAVVINEQRSVKPVYEEKPIPNPIELLFSEIDKCMEDNLPIPALFIGLSLPSIMASVVYKNLPEREGYIKVFRETYESYYPQNEPGTPYMCGELCYELKKAICGKGSITISKHFKDFDLDRVELKTQRKKNLEIFFSCITTGFHADGTTLNSIDFNVREFCQNLYKSSSQYLMNHKSEFDSMPKINIFDIDKEHEDMVECSIHSKTINEQILRYAELKHKDNN